MCMASKDLVCSSGWRDLGCTTIPREAAQDTKPHEADDFGCRVVAMGVVDLLARRRDRIVDLRTAGEVALGKVSAEFVEVRG